MNRHISAAMTSFRAVEQSLPLVRFGFRPTDDELLTQFLMPKILGGLRYQPPIPDIKVCDYEPWDLPGLIKPISDDQVWYFFCPRDYKYLRSHRSNRTTKIGHWKPTGKPRNVLSKSKVQIGTKKSLVFYIREKPKSIRTRWIIHEYECASNSSIATLGSFVLCKLMLKAGENTGESELVDMISEFDLDSQNLNEMTVNSSCDEQEWNIHSNMSIYEKGEWTCFSGSFDEAITSSAGNEDIFRYDLGFSSPNATSTCVNGKLSCLTRDFEGQNPYQNIDISASEEGEWNPCGPLPSHTDINEAEVDKNSLLNYVNGLNLDELLIELAQGDNYNCAFNQLPISPSESSSYCSFSANGEGNEIRWDNELFSLSR